MHRQHSPQGAEMASNASSSELEETVRKHAERPKVVSNRAMLVASNCDTARRCENKPLLTTAAKPHPRLPTDSCGGQG